MSASENTLWSFLPQSMGKRLKYFSIDWNVIFPKQINIKVPWREYLSFKTVKFELHENHQNFSAKAKNRFALLKKKINNSTNLWRRKRLCGTCNWLAKKESLLTLSNTAASVFRDRANSCNHCAYLCTGCVCSEVVHGCLMTVTLMTFLIFFLVQ